MNPWFRLPLLLLGLFLLGTTAAKDVELLEPESAFRFSARLASPQEIEVQYRIAEGYYMYREKFRFEINPPATLSGNVKFPHGKIKNDPLFGKVEIYRRKVTIRIPVSTVSADDKIEIYVTSQGCADAGVCYPKMKSSALLGMSSQATQNDIAKPLSSLFNH
jgi:thiol:disulfide interchange protein DsbD